jgi:hypothetical protein
VFLLDSLYRDDGRIVDTDTETNSFRSILQVLYNAMIYENPEDTNKQYNDPEQRVLESIRNSNGGMNLLRWVTKTGDGGRTYDLDVVLIYRPSIPELALSSNHFASIVKTAIRDAVVYPIEHFATPSKSHPVYKMDGLSISLAAISNVLSGIKINMKEFENDMVLSKLLMDELFVEKQLRILLKLDILMSLSKEHDLMWYSKASIFLMHELFAEYGVWNLPRDYAEHPANVLGPFTWSILFDHIYNLTLKMDSCHRLFMLALYNHIESLTLMSKMTRRYWKLASIDTPVNNSSVYNPKFYLNFKEGDIKPSILFNNSNDIVYETLKSSKLVGVTNAARSKVTGIRNFSINDPNSSPIMECVLVPANYDVTKGK